MYNILSISKKDFIPNRKEPRKPFSIELTQNTELFAKKVF